MEIDVQIPLLLCGVSLTIGFMLLSTSERRHGVETIRRSIVSMFFLASVSVVAEVFTGIMSWVWPAAAVDPIATAQVEIQNIMILVDAVYGIVITIWTGAGMTLGVFSTVTGRTFLEGSLIPALMQDTNALIALNGELVLMWWTLYVFDVVLFPLFMTIGAFMSGMSFIKVEKKGYWIMLYMLMMRVLLPLAVHIAYTTTWNAIGANFVFVAGTAITPWTMPLSILWFRASMVYLYGILVAAFMWIARVLVTQALGEEAQINILGFISSRTSGG
ncbi:MAG: hypothetical protein DRQ24_11275 [Candidatus Latescibacterota bacterium]|nr:MAG: hypothetical protein DRQ24_11275 [Candidatus Latescibacterota bacterium]